MSRSQMFLVMAVTALLNRAARTADYNWTNAAGGNWNVASNWSPLGGPPTSLTDNATLGTLSGAYTVQLTDAQSVNNLTISAASATLTATGNLTVGGTFAVNAGAYNLNGGTLTLNGTMTTGSGGSATWTGGSLTGTGTLAGTLTASAPSLTSALEISGAGLKISGTFAWTEGEIAGPGVFDETVGITNLPSGTIDFRADGHPIVIDIGGGAQANRTIVNQGTLLKSAGTASSTSVDWAVTNIGTIRNNVAGTLTFASISPGGLSPNVMNTGLITMVNGATIGGNIASNTNGQVQGPAGGTGTYGGLTFNSGSTLEPGGGQAGELDMTALTMTAGSTYFMRIGNTTPVTGFSRIKVSDTTSLVGNVTLAGDSTGFNPTPADTLFILLSSGGLPITGTFDNGASTVTVGGFEASISYVGDSLTGTVTGGHDVVLYNFLPVPEPGTFALCFAAAAAAAVRAIRRRSWSMTSPA
jgi:hypothetical protein